MSTFTEDLALQVKLEDYFEMSQQLTNLERMIDEVNRKRRLICEEIEAKLVEGGHKGLRHRKQNYVVVTRRQAKYLLPVQESKKYKEISE